MDHALCKEFNLITDAEFGEIVGWSAPTRARARRSGDGPRFVKIGRRVFYRRDEINRWLKSVEAASTADLQVRAQRTAM